MFRFRSTNHRSASILAILIFLMMTLGQPQAVSAAQLSLVVASEAAERQFSATELLSRPDSTRLNVAGDVYHGTVPYRAVPLLALLSGLNNGRFDTIEARARDGFVSQLPLELIARGAHGGAVAWVAVEDPARPWPPLPNKADSAGPFYLIWEYPERSGVVAEQWPYRLVRLSLVESPLHRWPQLALPINLPAGSPARRGQELFLTNCLACHRLNGGGASDTGPDLARPMSPTQYLSDAGLRAIIRDPRSVRTWPEQHMVGFDKDTLPDVDLEAIVAYLHVMAGDFDAVTAK